MPADQGQTLVEGLPVHGLPAVGKAHIGCLPTAIETQLELQGPVYPMRMERPCLDTGRSAIL
jgi:hypothetical protein